MSSKNSACSVYGMDAFYPGVHSLNDWISCVASYFRELRKGKVLRCLYAAGTFPVTSCGSRLIAKDIRAWVTATLASTERIELESAEPKVPLFLGSKTFTVLVRKFGRDRDSSHGPSRKHPGLRLYTSREPQGRAPYYRAGA